MPNSTLSNHFFSPSEATLSFIREFAHSYRVMRAERNIVYALN